MQSFVQSFVKSRVQLKLIAEKSNVFIWIDNSHMTVKIFSLSLHFFFFIWIESFDGFQSRFSSSIEIGNQFKCYVSEKFDWTNDTKFQFEISQRSTILAEAEYSFRKVALVDVCMQAFFIYVAHWKKKWMPNEQSGVYWCFF